MVVFLNGNFVPEQEAVVSVFDRSFCYGDGLFETMLVRHGKIFRWGLHFDRLNRGAGFLRIPVPFKSSELKKAAEQLIADNRMPDAVLRLHLSRGVGPRGYSARGADKPLMVMSLHPAPAPTSERLRWRLITSRYRVAINDELAQHKTASRLLQVMAKTEAEAADADEALLLNTGLQLVDCASTNLFWIYRDTVCTPPHSLGGLPGVTRAIVLELCSALGLSTRKLAMKTDAVLHSDGVFLTNCVHGVIEAVSLDGQDLPLSPITAQIAQAYTNLLEKECGGAGAAGA
jgi:aminodeoxychorismate lyase